MQNWFFKINGTIVSHVLNIADCGEFKISPALTSPLDWCDSVENYATTDSGTFTQNYWRSFPCQCAFAMTRCILMNKTHVIMS